jgi:hypothetical protein
MDPEEKRLWVGITVFATLFGVGGYIVFEHALWGWIFMVAGLGGLILGLRESPLRFFLGSHNLPWVRAAYADRLAAWEAWGGSFKLSPRRIKSKEPLRAR